MKSPIKWVGGKSKEINKIDMYIPDFNIYVEPFVGGGALFWYLQPEKAILSDINHYLIKFYVQLKNNYDKLCEYNQNHKHNKQYYNQMVEKINKVFT